VAKKANGKTNGEDRDEKGKFTVGNEVKTHDTRRNKPWSEAIRLAVNRYHEEDGSGESKRKLTVLAEKLVDEAILNGDVKKMIEIGNRLEGKAVERVEVHDKEEAFIETEDEAILKDAIYLATLMKSAKKIKKEKMN
jgi:hypothetical protein|tara:strand:- start:686 stop:1096 length:411 start_codon:yes stop_codon:yes gene_type:complete